MKRKPKNWSLQEISVTAAGKKNPWKLQRLSISWPGIPFILHACFLMSGSRKMKTTLNLGRLERWKTWARDRYRLLHQRLSLRFNEAVSCYYRPKKYLYRPNQKMKKKKNKSRGNNFWAAIIIFFPTIHEPVTDLFIHVFWKVTGVKRLREMKSWNVSTVFGKSLNSFFEQRF